MKKKQAITMKTTLERSPFYVKGRTIFLRKNVYASNAMNKHHANLALGVLNSGYNQALDDIEKRSQLFCKHLGI